MRPGRVVVLLLLVVLVVSGALAAGGLLAGGLEATGKNRPVFWSAFIASLFFFTGVGHGAAWIAAWAALSGKGDAVRSATLRAASLVALLAGAVGAINPLLHLGRPLKFHFTMEAPMPRSPLFWDMVGVQLFTAAAAALVLAVWVSPRFAALARLSFLVPWLAAGTALGALAAEVVAVWILAMPALPGWSLPGSLPTSLVMALLAGFAAVALGRIHLGEPGEHIGAAGKSLLRIAVLAFAVAVATHLVGFFAGDAAETAVLGAKMHGAYRAPFWTVAVAAFALPLLLLARDAGRTPRAVAAAALLVLAGLWLERWVGLVASLSEPRLALFAGTTKLSSVELRIALGEAGLVAMGFVGLARLLATREARA